MLKKHIAVFFFIAIFSLLNFNSTIFARSGCCSHHGGVCGCGCCDGTPLSAKCAPYYPGCSGGTSTYFYPTPKPIPTIPSTTNGSFKYYINDSGGVDLLFDWERLDGKPYSIVMSKNPGGDPGPNADTNESEYLFEDISPGRWYINVKESFSGTWSRVSYWTIDIPENVKSIAIAYPKPTPIKRSTPEPKKTEENEDLDGFGTIATLLVGVGGFSFIKNSIKKVKE